jgi:spermidine synthase
VSSPDPRRRLLLAAFFLSGLAALVFELVWTRLLLLAIGATAAAVGVVLAAFMGGMALGSALAGTKRVSRLDPVLAFAALEGFVAAYALASPSILAGIGSLGRVGFQLLFALVALLPATVAMGASLPVLIRAFARSDEPAAASLGRLYAANTLGAVLGPLLSVFWFFPSIGLSSTLRVGAALDLLVCVGLLLARRRLALAPGAVEPDRAGTSFSALGPRTVPVSLLLAVGLSGASAMVYEVAWSRTLSMVYGSSVYGVSIMLSTFLLGIAGGAALTARFLGRHRPEAPMARLAKALVFSATFAFASLLVARSLPFLFLNFYASMEGFQGSEAPLFFSQFVISALLMLPSTAALGATLPLAVDALPQASDLGSQVARLYSANLLGSSLGAFSASLLLLASLGIELSIRAVAIAVLVLALVLLSRAPKFSIPTAAFAGSAILLLLALDPSSRGAAKSFGVYSGARAYSRLEMSKLRELVAAHQQLFYRDGPTASVAVQQIDRFRLLKINGKTDASNGPGDLQTQLLIGHLPFLVAEPKKVAVVGWGSGMTVGAVLKHPVAQVDAFEIEPAVVEASRFFEPDNGKPLADHRVQLLLGDARRELRRRAPGSYDLVINEPSNPWLTGVANLFTRDFFEIAASRLTEDGVFCQWFQLYGMSEDSTRSLLSTFRSVFPHVVVFRDRDLIVLGSKQPVFISVERLKGLFGSKEIAESLSVAGIRYPSDVLASMRLDSPGVEAFAGAAPLNTDDNMRIELRAPKTLYRDEVESIVAAMRAHRPDVVSHLSEMPSEAWVRSELAASYFTAGDLDAALENAQRSVALDASFEGQKLLGQILQQLGRKSEARAALEGALDAGGDPEGRRFVEAMLRSLSAPTGS